ncbi:sensor histidine kinase [Pelagovum pacificum]|uniref:histidine kinase n=1 Tax=Pelagovum pacificum TaxID=2588711 RepID=A0A5C5GFD4_9RHOB|nr:HAMP domain-containing sensor histidine kinase [Pelagovum pacificum]QQA43393.1 HAMP domain-containing histidine kinase [Pelagovum pacificum]TNY33468.1 HAMP domain-containing histidine kinase [Pelagovum pacificum]
MTPDQAQIENDRKSAASKRLLKNVRDYSRAVITLTWQRQGIFSSVALLAGWFFAPWKAALFFAVCMICEFIDLRMARRVQRIEKGDSRATRRAYAGYITNTTVSTLAISVFGIWVGITEDGVAMFTALFCLIAAALYAAINNHQLASALAIRLTGYGVAFLVITSRDLYVYRPPLTSDMWLQFFTIIFLMYFLIDCSLGFLRLYRQDLKQLEDLEAQHEKVKAALVLKSQFVAVVSHELRTPLTSIKGSLDLLNSGKFGTFPPQAESMLKLVGRNSRRLANLVDDLLDLQKLEEGKMRFEKETVDLQSFLNDALTSHQGLADRYDVQLNLRMDVAATVYVHTDVSRLMQVLANVISNAAKFSPEKGEVDIWLKVANGRAHIYVRDHGVGIPEGSKEAVFGRFVQLDSSAQRQFGGTGLGMAISREIIEAIGGTIDYESEVGVGTTFEIELPCTTVFDSGNRTTAISKSVDDPSDRQVAISARS